MVWTAWCLCQGDECYSQHEAGVVVRHITVSSMLRPPAEVLENGVAASNAIDTVRLVKTHRACWYFWWGSPRNGICGNGECYSSKFVAAGLTLLWEATKKIVDEDSYIGHNSHYPKKLSSMSAFTLSCYMMYMRLVFKGSASPECRSFRPDG